LDWAGDWSVAGLAPPRSNLPQFSPDGRRVVTDCYGNPPVNVVDVPRRLDPGAPHLLPHGFVLPRGNSVMHPTWAPDGEWLVFSMNRGRVRQKVDCPLAMKKVNTDAPIRWIVDNGACNTRPRVSPDGRAIAFAASQDAKEFHLWLASVDEPHESMFVRRCGLEQQFLSDWSPDGRKLLSGCPWGWRVLTFGGLDPRQLKLTTELHGGALLVVAANGGARTLKPSVTYQLFDARSVQIAEAAVDALDIELDPGDVVECQLTLPATKQPGIHTVKLTAVTEEGERVVELVDHVGR